VPLQSIYGFDLALGPSPHMLDRCQGCGSVGSWRLVVLVAELDCAGGEHVGLGGLPYERLVVYRPGEQHTGKIESVMLRHVALGPR